MELRTTLQQAAALLQAGRISDSADACVNRYLPRCPVSPTRFTCWPLPQASGESRLKPTGCFAPASPPRQHRMCWSIMVFSCAVSGAWRRPRRSCAAAVKLAPEFAAGWHNLGLLLHAAGKLQEASRCAQTLTSLEPARPAGWELLAAIQQKQGDNTAALAACEQGLVHAPAASRLHYSRAQLLREESRFGEAAAAYETALACGYETPDLYRNLAEALLESGELERALGSADAGIARYAEDALLHRTRARLHWETGAAGDPVAALGRAARTSPRNPELWATLAGLLNRLGREDESRAVLAEARNSGCPQTPDLLRLDALGEAHAGMAGAASAKFDQLLAAYPQHTESKLSFAQHLLATGDPARAEVLCSGILDAEPYDQLALAHRSTAWQMLGDPRAGWLVDYERMVRQVRCTPAFRLCQHRSVFPRRKGCTGDPAPNPGASHRTVPARRHADEWLPVSPQAPVAAGSGNADSPCRLLGHRGLSAGSFASLLGPAHCPARG